MLKQHGQNYCAAQKTVFDFLLEKSGNPAPSEIQMAQVLYYYNPEMWFPPVYWIFAYRCVYHTTSPRFLFTTIAVNLDAVNFIHWVDPIIL